jgi:hypothetical protein
MREVKAVTDTVTKFRKLEINEWKHPLKYLYKVKERLFEQ